MRIDVRPSLGHTCHDCLNSHHLCCYKTQTKIFFFRGGSQCDELYQHGSLMHFRQVPLMKHTDVYCEAQAKGLTFWVTVQLQSSKEPNKPVALMSVSKIKICLMPGWFIVLGKPNTQLRRKFKIKWKIKSFSLFF